MYNPKGYVPSAKIKVIGVGGGGCNAVNHMDVERMGDVEFWVANTDQQVIGGSTVKNKLVLGPKLSKGLGAGGNPELGKKSALECEDDIRKLLEGSDMVFIAAGMGGGTGTGAAPVIAKVAKEMDILTVAVVTRPFMFEGKRRLINAENGIKELRENVDSIIVIPNERLLSTIGKIPFREAFVAADTILRQAVQTITDLIGTTAYINLDFADVRTTLKNQGAAIFGIGIESGEGRATKAALKAINCPLLESSIVGCTNAVVNITGCPDITIEEVEDAVETIRSHAGTDVNIIFGFAINEDLKDEVIVTIVATGITEQPFDAMSSHQKMMAEPLKTAPQPAKREEMNSFFRSSRGNV